MTESFLQAKIIKIYQERGWYVVKVLQCNKNGFPDLILLKDGKTFCIEVKAEKGRLSPLQKFRHEELLKHGIETKVINSIDGIDIYI